MLRPAGGWRKTRRRCQDCDDRSASSWGRGPPRTVGSEREKQPTLAIQLWDVGTVNREILFFLVVLDKGLSCGVVGIRANYRPVARGGGQQQQRTWCQSPQPPDPLKASLRNICGTEKTPTSASPGRFVQPSTHSHLSPPVPANRKYPHNGSNAFFWLSLHRAASRGGACSTAALQLLITNKGCIVYQHLQSAPGTRCSAHVF